MKLRHIWSVLCDRSITDGETNNVSLIEVFEKLTIDVGEDFLKKLAEQQEKKPIVFPHAFVLTSLWYRDEAAGNEATDFRMELLDPTRRVLETNDFQFTVPDGKLRLRTNIRLPGLPVTQQGMYWFRISSRGVGEQGYAEVAAIPLEVEIHLPNSKGIQ